MNNDVNGYDNSIEHRDWDGFENRGPDQFLRDGIASGGSGWYRPPWSAVLSVSE